ncbi:MAG: hypothetical protein CVU56_15145 [Deltaproteobacteria bacterium HGW-Deltaproteobacteria-14]|jgi:hypothetical protein|nr:MAG: hypothetical protein CVU56_15145 [Deltaproteobacteria bacterium HGW-Deltaproteobacteria-14]
MNIVRLGTLVLALTLGAAPALAAPPPDRPATDPGVAPEEAPAPPTAPSTEPVDAPPMRPAEPAPERPVEAATAASPAVDRTLSTAGTRPWHAFAFWTSEDGRDFIKPVLQLATMMVAYAPQSDSSDGLAARFSTLAMARFGLEGELFDWISFRSVFERNLGFSLGRNGPVGTSVWEGTAALQARENYIQLHRGGFTLTGGIFPDPASVDYFSTNVLDAFGVDPYVRDPLLISGFNQGQGVMARYTAGGFTAGFSFTAGNPLISSLSFGFGGDLTSLGTLYTAPLRTFTNGIPASDIQMTVLSPSVTFESPAFDIKATGQFYLVDVDATKDTDKSVNGFNARVTAQVKLLDQKLRIFASGAVRRNQQLDVTDLSKRIDAYTGVVGAGGFDLAFGDFGFGAQYYYLHSEFTEKSNLTSHYLNVGLTWWLEPPYLSAGLRWGRTMTSSEPSDPRVKTTDSVILSMRLLL